VIFELNAMTFWMLKVTVRRCGRGREMEVVMASHVRIWTKGKVGVVHLQWLRVKRISAGRERRVVFLSEVDVFPVLSDVREGVATDHGRVVSLLVGMRGESRLDVVSSPGDVSPGGILTAILVVVKVGYICTDGVGVIEFLHERTPGVVIGNLMRLLPGVADN
jgi:hypothetical protein